MKKKERAEWQRTLVEFVVKVLSELRWDWSWKSFHELLCEVCRGEGDYPQTPEFFCGDGSYKKSRPIRDQFSELLKRRGLARGDKEASFEKVMSNLKLGFRQGFDASDRFPSDLLHFAYSEFGMVRLFERPSRLKEFHAALMDKRRKKLGSLNITECRERLVTLLTKHHISWCEITDLDRFFEVMEKGIGAVLLTA
jgi:hypothetical protein